MSENMDNEENGGKLEETKKSLERMQNFDSSVLSRQNDLGKQLSFKPAIEPARRLINLYKQLSLSILEDLPESHLDKITSQANSDYSYFDAIQEFSAEEENPSVVREDLITNISTAYNGAFNTLHQLVSYSTSKSADFKRLESDARAMIQSVRDQAKDLTTELESQNTDAKKILDDVRKLAAEQGVSQQAVYFQEAAKEHESEADGWQTKTFLWGIGLALYAIASIFLHKIPGLSIVNSYLTVQLAVSKVLMFAVISYMLYLSARNFIAHKHNAIVNKHRQNALMTYEALVDAAKETPNKEIILTHASECIFSPQGTGYSKEAASGNPGSKVIEMLSKPLSSSGS